MSKERGTALMTHDIDENDVATVLDAVHRGYRDRAPGAIAEHYAPNAEIYDLAPPLAHPIDAKEIGDWLAGWGAPVERTFRGMNITVRGDMAFCHGLAHVGTRTKGGDDVSWWMRITICLLRQDSVWKIVHEHSSVPFYMDGSFRAAIDLTPVG
jgi:ketosteroid isomerase-like protein